MYRVFYPVTLFILVIAFNQASQCEDNKKEVEFRFVRSADVYDKRGYSLRSPEGDNAVDTERKKKGKKGTKKGSKGGEGLDPDSLDFYPEPNIEENSVVRPPLFPCNKPECIILVETLADSFCNNECEDDSHCQGRKDTRVQEENIAVCVPDGSS